MNLTELITPKRVVPCCHPCGAGLVFLQTGHRFSTFHSGHYPCGNADPIINILADRRATPSLAVGLSLLGADHGLCLAVFLHQPHGVGADRAHQPPANVRFCHHRA